VKFKGFVVAIGDSEVDVEMLKCADFKAAPSNADVAVKEVVDYVSSKENGDGVIEILERLKRMSALGTALISKTA
jgi:hydroxymethylpyrimidine pyrophosphatase-like HAD family hydrolase